MVPDNPGERFTDRVASYMQSRPGYPAAVVDTLTALGGWAGAVDIADLGSGTGLSALPFLQRGHRVHGVEPNAAMRAGAQTWLAGFPAFSSVDGSAEASTLADASMDLVLSAQAFHWFEPTSAARETRRILRPGGLVAVLWNLRRTTGSAFLDGYEQLLRQHGTDYAAVSECYAEPRALRKYFGALQYREYAFDYVQMFDLPGLRQRLLSSSYTPPVGHPGHAPMLAALERLHDETAVDGKVAFEYDTRLFVAQQS